MTLALILVLIAVAVLLLLFAAARGQARRARSVDQLEGMTRPVDTEAFVNLISAEDQKFLLESLLPEEFRRVERARTRAALDYVGRMRCNAAILIRLGEAARESADPQIAAAGRELAQIALRVRLNTLAATWKLYRVLLFPGGSQGLETVLARYRSLTEATIRLGRLQQPALAGRIGAAL